ncbi:hypothetical protein M5W98_30305, partial [Paenibacillus apiarius]|nr:hypothetical protein [Paenibacillus apiarius]
HGGVPLGLVLLVGGPVLALPLELGQHRPQRVELLVDGPRDGLHLLVAALQNSVINLDAHRFLLCLSSRITG